MDDLYSYKGFPLRCFFVIATFINTFIKGFCMCRVVNPNVATCSLGFNFLVFHQFFICVFC